MYVKYVKRLLDIVVSSLGIVFLFPLLLIVIVILVVNKQNPFFIQPRTGKDDQVFNIIKFKTMNDKKDDNGTLLPDNKRISSVGIFLRSTSIDEIPQLINVIKGDMSLIGPRPLLPEYVPLYNKTQKRRNEVRPGITGWAQVNGRNSITWDQKFKNDIWYVDNISFKTDMKILLLTFKKVLNKEGINSSLFTTMEKFQGNN